MIRNFSNFAGNIFDKLEGTLAEAQEHITNLGTERGKQYIDATKNSLSKSTSAIITFTQKQMNNEDSWKEANIDFWNEDEIKQILSPEIIAGCFDKTFHTNLRQYGKLKSYPYPNEELIKEFAEESERAFLIIDGATKQREYATLRNKEKIEEFSQTLLVAYSKISTLRQLYSVLFSENYLGIVLHPQVQEYISTKIEECKVQKGLLDQSLVSFVNNNLKEINRGIEAFMQIQLNQDILLGDIATSRNALALAERSANITIYKLNLSQKKKQELEEVVNILNIYRIKYGGILRGGPEQNLSIEEIASTYSSYMIALVNLSMEKESKDNTPRFLDLIESFIQRKLSNLKMYIKIRFRNCVDHLSKGGVSYEVGKTKLTLLNIVREYKKISITAENFCDNLHSPKGTVEDENLLWQDFAEIVTSNENHEFNEELGMQIRMLVVDEWSTYRPW